MTDADPSEPESGRCLQASYLQAFCSGNLLLTETCYRSMDLACQSTSNPCASRNLLQRVELVVAINGVNKAINKSSRLYVATDLKYSRESSQTHHEADLSRLPEHAEYWSRDTY